MRARTVARASIVVVALSLLAADASAQRIQMPVGYRLTWIGARWQVGARVVDPGTGRAVAAPLAYRMSDPTIASVNNRGEVVARKPGRTSVWAVSGRDSASALIMVEQWPARFAFSPASLRLDALGMRQPIRVVASDSAGVPIVGGASRVSACRSLNERIASINGSEVVAVGNGSTYIRCSDRGLADSVRVDVQQRPVAAAITNKLQLNRRFTVGDTFSVRVVARDRLQKDVADARPTWASLSPSTVSVDPVTGKARAVNGGSAKIIVQVGDVADSTTVNIEGAALFSMPVVAATADTTTKRGAKITARETYLQENDTTYMDLSATDSAGQLLSLADLRVRVLDTAIAVRIDSARVWGKKLGSTKAVVSFGSLVDTLVISVRSRTVDGPGARYTGDTTAEAAFRPPPAFLDSIPVYQARRALVNDSITTNALRSATQQNLVVTPLGFVSIAEHLSKTEAGVIEDRTGAMYGGGGTLLLYQKFELGGAFRVGTLSSVQSVGSDLTVTEAEGSIGVFPIQQLGVRGGVILRGERDPIATQNWMVPKVSLVTRFTFIGDMFSTYAVLSVLPKASYSGLDERGSLFSRGGEAGIDFRRNWFSGGVTYYVEQLSFSESQRAHSFSSIRLRVGANLGK